MSDTTEFGALSPGTFSVIVGYAVVRFLAIREANWGANYVTILKDIIRGFFDEELGQFLNDGLLVAACMKL